MGKRGQAANEAAMITLMVLFVLSIFMAVLSDELTGVIEKNYKDSLEAVADVIEAEANIALAAEEGYFHSFVLPPRLAGSRYTFQFINSTSLDTPGIQINASIVRVHALQGDRTYYTDRMLQRNVLGNLVRAAGSLNSVSKHDGNVIFRPVMGANPPAILTVSPAEGLGTGGTSVVITGTDFCCTTVDRPTVTFGGVAAATVTFNSITQLTATTPVHAAGQVDVTVTNPDSQPDTLNGGFRYTSGGLGIGASCSADGDCISNICGTNFDNDGYFSQAAGHTGTCQSASKPYTDCYDSRSNVNPSQVGYFTLNRGDGSFDYNCDGSETKLFTIDCVATLADQQGCSQNSLPGTGGYITAIPACGVGGTFRYCRLYSGSGCSGFSGSLGCIGSCDVGGPVTRVRTYDSFNMIMQCH